LLVNFGLLLTNFGLLLTNFGSPSQGSRVLKREFSTVSSVLASRLIWPAETSRRIDPPFGLLASN